ncbi:hypothetical protein [Nocardia aurantia]|uniref:Band 7 domain-containing protein n=1 Tax=Nocardia aurantia TaxID=2585199 RepID=A0A7K0DWI1_9NOCA|nr:hypothetical protein [Nocardia aurantia]MQY29194.1 hypothetical protein [Nocardia aurantia]
MSANGRSDLLQYARMTWADWWKFRPVSGGHWVTVTMDAAGELRPIDRRPTTFINLPTGVYWVDTSIHHASLRLELPAAEGVLNFLADVDLSWRIVNPVQAVQDRVVNGENIYRPFVEHELRVRSRRFEAARFTEAEEHVNNTFVVRPVELPCGAALLNCKVRLRPEPDTFGHLKQRIFDARAAEHRAAENRAQLNAVRLTMQENEAEHGLASQSARFEHELAALAERNRLELEQAGIAHYAKTLQDGGIEMLLALRLASGRTDVDDVIQMVMTERKVDLDTAKGIVEALLGQRLYNKRDVAPLMAGVSAVIQKQVKHPPLGAPTPEPARQLTGSNPVSDADESDDADDDSDDPA